MVNINEVVHKVLQPTRTRPQGAACLIGVSGIDGCGKGVHRETD